MSRKTKIIFIVFSITYLGYHIYTLPLNPLPWFDETFFVSITKNFAESGKFIPEVSKEVWHGEEIFYHGPLYYILESMSYKLFGFSIYSFRWLTLVFGILTIFATGILLKYYPSNSKIFWLLILTFALDPFMNLSMHEGRMDVMTIFFMLASVVFLLKGIDEEKIKFFFISGLASSFALLTTPRVAFIYIVVGLVFLFSLEGASLKKSLKQLFWWSMPVGVLYSIWIFYAFGSFTGLYNYYQNLRQNTAEYIGGKFYVPKHEYVLISLTALSVIIGIVRYKLKYFNKTVIISFLSIPLFYFIVWDYGPYSMLILPFYYFLLFHTINNAQFSWKNISWYPFLVVFIFNVFFFGIKSAQALADADLKNPAVAEAFVKKNIPQGSKVIGGAEYYYAVILSGSEYRLFDQFLSDEDRERLLREEFDYDYYIVTERSREINPQLVELFLKKATFKKVAELKLQESILSKKIGKLGIVSNAEKNGYNAEIYVRIKEQKSLVAVVHENLNSSTIQK